MTDRPFTIYDRRATDYGHVVYRLRGRDGHLVTVSLASGFDDAAHLEEAYRQALQRRYIRRGRSNPPRI